MNESARSEDAVARLRTGIQGFDAISGGGLPRGRTTLVAGTAGSAKTIFAVEYLVRGIEDFRQPGVLVTFEETPADITQNVRSLGWDLDDHVRQGQLAFVDVSPEPSQPAIETGAYDFSALLARIGSAVLAVGAQRVVIDSVSTLFLQFADAALVRRELFRLAAALRGMHVTSLVTAERVTDYGDLSRFGVEEFVADNVVVLRNVLGEERRRRTIEILKYRGVDHKKGEYPFTISPEGIQVLPLSTRKLAQPSSTTRISSGNEELDRMCGGGFFRDSVILVSGATGTGKTLLMTTFLEAGCSRGEKTLLFAFEESRDQLARNAGGWGMDLDRWQRAGLMRIVCAYPESMGLEDHLVTMKKEMESFRPARVAVDSLSALERVASVKALREFAIGLASHIKSCQTAGLLTTTTPSLTGGSSITDAHVSTVTDTIVLLRYVELLGQMRRGLTVLKMRGSGHDKSIRQYEIDSTGMHLGKAFRQVGGILAGAPVQYAAQDPERLGAMFSESPAPLPAAMPP